jgi:ribosomal protein S18 acetylase RimI-like enzyme
MHLEDWLADPLRAAGFAPYTEVVTWRAHDLRVHAAGHSGLRVRPALRSDLSALAGAEAAAFAPLWRLSAPTLARMLDVATTFTVAELDGEVIGFQFSTIDGVHAHLIRLTVRPEWQSRGVGTRLVDELFALCAAYGVRTLTLNTQRDNLASQRLYTRFGFQVTPDGVPVWRREIQ